jgi:NADPH:quinone reductase-like Zn-dependent oxidoreductase
MGGMGRDFNGGYAQYTCVPASQVQVIKPKISWEQLGALPEMMQTAWQVSISRSIISYFTYLGSGLLPG